MLSGDVAKKQSKQGREQDRPHGTVLKMEGGIAQTAKHTHTHTRGPATSRSRQKELEE